MSAIRRFKSYVNLRTTERKLDRILSEFPVTTFRALLKQNQAPEAFTIIENRYDRRSHPGFHSVLTIARHLQQPYEGW